ncbi:C40 family peptidase [Paenibacillus albicereus]|uniref:C40 family peptidase n=1 Tax=Paenibacillus albicereus TaxID=2726185 RepID=A0A6H2H1G6_9BACL|nr:NlpC/P60 family protein [Paenibacillus albicereus]QJC53485.1 C40 family peptidase [Paenibacillus albicereus]
MKQASGKEARVAVSVAGVWTSPAHAREQDAPALASPADVRGWLGSMGFEQRLDLCEGNRLQTQLLLGERVLVAEEKDGWARIHAPAQTTAKEAGGYPGWMPLVQLVFDGTVSVPERGDAALRAVVTAESAWLHRGGIPVGSAADQAASAPAWTGGSGPAAAEAAAPAAAFSCETSDIAAEAAEPGAACEPQPWIELSFLTELPAVAERGEWVEVSLPHGGGGLLRRSDIRLIGPEKGAAGSGEGRHAGRIIVEQAKRYLGLPYLWGGISSFGYDCSGLAYAMHRAAGFAIPRDASDQARNGLPVDREELTPGDLLFFAYEEGLGRVHHVGIYAGGGRMIHSPRTGRCVELVKFDESYELYREHCASRRYWS